MGVFHIASAPPSVQFDERKFLPALRDAFGELSVSRRDSGSEHRVEWAHRATHGGSVSGALDADSDSITLEGLLEDVAQVAVVIRGTVDPSSELLICDTEYTWTLPLVATTQASEIVSQEE